MAYPGADEEDAKPVELQQEKAHRGEPAPVLNPEAAQGDDASEQAETDSAEDTPEQDDDE